MELNDICREARLKSGISLRRAAREMGYSHQAVALFEKGQVQRINPDMLIWYRDNTEAFENEDIIWLLE